MFKETQTKIILIFFIIGDLMSLAVSSLKLCSLNPKEVSFIKLIMSSAK